MTGVGRALALDRGILPAKVVMMTNVKRSTSSREVRREARKSTVRTLRANPPRHRGVVRPAGRSGTGRGARSTNRQRTGLPRVASPLQRSAGPGGFPAAASVIPPVPLPTNGTPAAVVVATVQTRPAGAGDRDGDMSLRLYLREISETPLLTIQDEIDLAGRIQKGDAAAREHMITANLRLVVKIARDYEGMGLPLLDMVNEGNMGLMRAVERFDPTKGAKLSTYAAWWIKQSIKRGIANQGKTIRLPVHLVDRVAKIRRAALKLHEELGREPTEAEIAEAMGMKAERVGELLAASCRPASLDAPVGDDDDTRFADLVRDENSATAFECLDESSRHDMVLELVGRLDEREIAVIRERFGLNGRSERTLEQIGQRFGVTRERIRQIEVGALRKLRKLVERREAQIDPDLESFREAA